MSDTIEDKSDVDDVRRIRGELWAEFHNHRAKFLADMLEFEKKLHAQGFQFYDPRKDRKE